MAITIVSQNDFQKGVGYNVQTGAGEYNLPRDDVDALYGPGWPIQPVTRPEDSDLPRVFDYPVGINYTLQPRVGYQGLFPVAALKAAYINVAEVAQPVNMIIRELSGFVPQLRDPKTQQRIAPGHPYEWMLQSPDGRVPFNVWMSLFKKSAKVYAAPAIYKRKEGGKLVGMEYIDGSTFFLIVNSKGRLPDPYEVDPELKKWVERVRYGSKHGDYRMLGGNIPMPDLARRYVEKAQGWLNKPENAGKDLPITTPAFTQIIKGIPFSFWDKNQVYFLPEPPSPAVDSPYGESYIERAWTWIQIIAVLTAFELGHYRTGNTPEGLMMMPKDMFPSMAKLAVGEKEWNARMADGSQVQHARTRWVPQDTKYVPTKKPDFPDKLYQQAMNNILLAIGVPPAETGQKPGKGLGGKGFEEGQAHEVTRQLLESEKASMEMPFNVLLREEGVDDAYFYMDYPQEEIDPSKQSEDVWNKFIHGVYTLNDVLSEQNKDPIGDIHDKENIANMHMIVAGTAFYVVEKMVVDDRGLAVPNSAQPGQEGGVPRNPVDQTAATGAEEMKTAQKLARILELTKGQSPEEKFYSIAKELGAGAGYGGYNLEGGVEHLEPPSGVDPEEFSMGISVEQEHAETVGGDQATIARIALDHLREDPHYYTHLAEVHVEKGDLEKRYKVYHMGGKYVVVNIDTGKPVKGGAHEHEASADRHARALYANVPDARKLKKVQVMDNKGAMISLYIPAGVAAKLGEISQSLKLPADAKLILPADMHLSLAVFPDGDLDDMKIRMAIQSVAVRYGALNGTIQGFGVFNGNGDEHVLYASLDSVELAEFRTEIIRTLEGNDIPYLHDHGFTPHITLAYFPDDWKLPEGFAVPDMPVTITEATFSKDNERVQFKLVGRTMAKVDWDYLAKHCGVCDEDAAYFNAPVNRAVHIPIPTGVHREDGHAHANPVELIMMTPESLPPQPAVWKPAGNENLAINEAIGGPQYKREEASWLLDQSLGFHLIPVSYVTQDENGEDGAAIWYTSGNTQVHDPATYGPDWIMKAAVFDYISSQQDRGNHHNYLTHPDDPSRVVLIDNGFSFPEDPRRYCESVFCELAVGKPLSDDIIQAINMCLADRSAWADIERLVGPVAVAKARHCAERLLKERMITPA